MDRDTDIGGRRGGFPTTRASVLESLRAPGEEERRAAAERLIAIYWKPLYKYARLRWRKSNEDAKDLVQEFFATALERETLATFDPEKASFRTFLRLLLDRRAMNELDAARRLKRGGGARGLDFDAAEAELARIADRADDPEELLRREWVRSLFTAAVDRLRDELRDGGRERRYRVFEAFELADTEGAARPTYREIGDRLGIPESTVTNELAAARRRFRALVLETLRAITATEAEFREEARAVLGVEP